MHRFVFLPLLLSLFSGCTLDLDCVVEGIFEDIFDRPENYQIVRPTEGDVGVVLECGVPCRIEPDAIYPAAFLDSEENVVIGTAKGLGFREIQSLDPLVATILWAPDDEPEDGLSTEVDKCAEIALVASSVGVARFDLLNRDGDRVGRFEVHVTAPIEPLPSE
ncbi:MAG: hypothetical protein R3B99_14880 [Polyangiales bacterium]|nr:hypothetical protein [Myxococcales bacterium]